MRRWLRLALVVVAVALAGAALFLVPTIWGRPWFIEHFYLRVFASFALRHPMMLSGMGLPIPPALDFYSDDLEDFSVAAFDRERRELAGSLATLRRYDRSRLEPEQRLSADVLEDFLVDMQEMDRFRDQNYPVNPTFGMQSMLPDFMINSHPVRRRRDAENYLARVGKFGVAIDQIIDQVRRREARGIVPPRFVLTRVLAEMRGFTGVPATANVLYLDFAGKVDSLAGLDAGRRAALKRQLAERIATVVYPAYGRLIAVCAHQESVATTDDGAWKLPDGAAYYAACLRHHTSTDMTADEIHELGVREVARLQGEMRRLLRAQGYAADSVGAAMERLRREPRFHYPDGDSGRARILADFQAILDEADRAVAPLFGARPKQGVVVKRVPEFREATAPSAYYESGSFDGTRPGVFFVNLRQVGEIAKPGMRTLAYHEGIPGHHFQITVAQELTGVPFFRRVIPFTAYAEGWALYAERLALEQGFHRTAADSLGAYASELFRAARLVVDTGIHAKRWTREQAIDYLRRTTGASGTAVVAEIERYIVGPGQACAYKVGQLKVLALRERARQRLGPRFDLKAFHDVLLTNGALPLRLLERVVDEWIAARGKAAA
jgi:uncharacterized protein (DUF885 family)